MGGEALVHGYGIDNLLEILRPPEPIGVPIAGVGAKLGTLERSVVGFPVVYSDQSRSWTTMGRLSHCACSGKLD